MDFCGDRLTSGGGLTIGGTPVHDPAVPARADAAALLPHDPAQVRAQIGAFEAALAQLPGAVFGDSALCPLQHHFADGVYGRAMALHEGTVLTGKLHREAHLCVLLQGAVIVVSEAGGRQTLTAPALLVAPAGTKRAFVALRDAIWLTVHANPDNTRDLAALEARLIAPDYAALEAAAAPPPAPEETP